MAKQIDKKDWGHLYPFRSNYLELDRLNYHYLDEGRGEPVVMLHGNPTWSFYYRQMVTALSPAYRVIVPDHIGCGLSDAPDAGQYGYRLDDRVNDLEKLLDYLQISKNITLMVHDWGGMIGMAFAVRHPERIARLIITNTSGFLPPGKKGIPVRLRLIRNLAPFAVPAVLGLNIFSEAALYMAPYKRLSKAVKAGLTAPYNTPARRFATLRFVQDIPLRPGDPSYPTVRHVDDLLQKTFADTPMIIIWGKHDFVFDTDYFREWKRRFPHAETHFFTDAGHYLLEDKPAETADLVKGFLKKHPM